MDIHHSSIKDFIMPKVKSVYIIDYFEGINGILAGRDDFLFKNLFANPRVRTQNEIIWSTEAFIQKPTLLSELTGYEKEKYSYLLNQCIHAVEALIDKLKEEEGGIPLSDLLSKSIPYIDEKSVYCGDGNIVIVNWGLIPRVQSQLCYQIYRSGKFVENWDKKHTVHPPHTDTEVSENATKGIQPNSPIIENDTPPSSTTYAVVPPKNIQTEKQAEEEEENIQTEAKTQETTSRKETNEEKETASTYQYSKQQESQSAPTSQQEPAIEPNDSNVNETSNAAHVSNKPQKYNWNTLFKNFWEGIKFLIKKLYWLIALIALLLLIMFLCKDCQGPVHKINPFYNPLPENPAIPPIKDGHTGYSSDSMNMIATDRLNILIEQQDENTMLEWAKAFKKIYDGDEYTIAYYNKDLDLIQILVPDDERERIKANLPNEMTGFSFEVFDETVQGGGTVITDPMVSNPSYAWYFNPIEAKEAWNITLGDEDVVIAVVDNGFDTKHPELSGKLVNSYNVLTRNNYLRPIVTKDGVDAHGTHVAATAAGNCNNGSGLLGIAPNCKLMLIQVGNDNADGMLSSTAVREGILYAINQGADVINVSLGMIVPDYLKNLTEGQQLNYISSSYRQEELLWNNVYAKAKKNNCTIVFAAGNDNMIAGIDPKKRSKHTIRVSAVDEKIQKTNFSNYGIYPALNREYSTLSAPGVSIYSAAPGNQYVTMQGTSMAAPIVSGAVALLKSLDKNLTTEEIIRLLKETGTDAGNDIGPVINIGKALLQLKGDTVVNNNCDAIKKEVELLKAKIDSLIKICPDAALPADTLKYKDAIKDKHGLDGVWKSTTELVNTSDQSPIELYMTFRKLDGMLTIVNKDKKYTASLQAVIKEGKIYITQNGPAANGNDFFRPYTYECKADKKGYLLCTATSNENKVIFNLIRTNN